MYNRIRRRIYGGWNGQDRGSLGIRRQQGADGCEIVNTKFTNIDGDDDYNVGADDDVMTKMIMIEIFE